MFYETASSVVNDAQQLMKPKFSENQVTILNRLLQLSKVAEIAREDALKSLRTKQDQI